MSGVTPLALRGRRILVAEDEYLIALEVANMLAEAGAETLGPMPSLADVREVITAGRQEVDAALLDVNLRGEAVWSVVDVLLAHGVPVVLATGYDVGAIPSPYDALPRCEKPVAGRDIIRALAQAMASPPSATI